ncbi:MAG: carbamoyl-phosphate synthase large subunit [Pseudomonadota bacterium]|nr:carbamoyl-phosphate synthase large subunit [Pseudomonadota bacterium]
MPRRTDISSILIIGAGPIVIGQACEFDYSGVQACKALREEGYRVVLVNSNPATIMTDPDMADATYVEPIRADMIEAIIAKEKPDAILPTMGGQTALNAAMELHHSGILERHGVELIGANAEAISKAEDRLQFRTAMDSIGLESPKSRLVKDMDETRDAMEAIGLPMIIRPSFTLGGAGGGVAYNRDEYEQIVAGGLAASPVGEVLVEESVLGWKEFEMEVVRDNADNCIIVCSIENVDPMGIHTGDSITVAPALTLTDKEYQIMRNASIAVLREIGVDTGGSNVQFAVNPDDGRLVIIEMNPRVSRSSALASKATGFPIAKIAAKLAVGYRLDELDNDITGVTPASFEPTIDYVVTKIPRFTFEKFPEAEPLLTTSMKSVGEAMAIGRNFAESLQKSLRAIEIGLKGLDEMEITIADGGRPVDADAMRDALRAILAEPRPNRILFVAQAFREGLGFKEIQAASRIDPWFLAQIEAIVDVEEGVRESGVPEAGPELLRLKKMGFSDSRLAELGGVSEAKVAEMRAVAHVWPVYKRVDTCAAEFPAQTSYMYSVYEGDGVNAPECEARPSGASKVVILGGGPNRIGQGIEFDYCCVHAAYAMNEAGHESIMVNCNPETVSTDYDTSDRLYFEPLTAEEVIALIRKEMEDGELLGVIVQFGGQTPLKLAHALENAGITILGTTPDAIDLAEDRERFQQLLLKLGLKQPPNGIATNEAEAEDIAADIGYPVVIRPSYVLGGRAMEIVHDVESLRRYMKSAVLVSGTSPVLIDWYLRNAIEVDVDAICDGENVYVCGIMEHIEEAGIHSGDSACSLPPHSLNPETIAELKRQTRAVALALGVVGLMNIQFAVQTGVVFILEVNPRASRTVPFVAKATGVPVAKIAARVMAGEKLVSFDLDEDRVLGHVSVKEAVFPFSRFPGVDIILGPEMKSTGEVMGIGNSFAEAFAKSQLGAGSDLPEAGCVFISVKDVDKEAAAGLAKALVELGFEIMATGGTARHLDAAGFPVRKVNKVLEGRPHCVDAIVNGEVQMIINTTESAQAIADSYSIRRTALIDNIPHYTTITGARAAISAIAAVRGSNGRAASGPGGLEVQPLQTYSNISA